MGGLIAMMIPYSLAFLGASLALTLLWVGLDLPLGPGATVGYTLPGGR
jgi:aminobenzoyl-glutamate transport protein